MIERRVRRLVQLLNVGKKESIFAQANRAEQIAECFTQDVSLNLDRISKSSLNIQGRAELRQTAVAARNRVGGMRFEAHGIKVTVNEESRTAEVDITLLIWQDQDPNPMVEDLCLKLRQEESVWLIAAVEGVAEKTVPLETR